ncbi:MAG: hypothetical protein A2W26_07520 [Acidobacteria bacterium RBG_16_64_8]|nr:MAG: hypothetical protein A2W26_07520 [Acidobacteria bacterium RBG_16_64_8]
MRKGEMLGARHWYAVQTKPRCEDQVVGWLQRWTDVPIFMPRLELPRRRRGRIVRVLEPLFPSYAFVHIELAPVEWYAVKWTPGVKGIVSTGGIPVPVPDDVIALLQIRCVDGRVQWQPHWKPGADVRVKAGPFAGVMGILDRPTSRPERVRVLLRLMRSVVPVEVDIVDLEAVGAAI